MAPLYADSATQATLSGDQLRATQTTLQFAATQDPGAEQSKPACIDRVYSPFYIAPISSPYSLIKSQGFPMFPLR